MIFLSGKLQNLSTFEIYKTACDSRISHKFLGLAGTCTSQPWNPVLLLLTPFVSFPESMRSIHLWCSAPRHTEGTALRAWGERAALVCSCRCFQVSSCSTGCLCWPVFFWGFWACISVPSSASISDFVEMLYLLGVLSHISFLHS